MAFKKNEHFAFEEDTKQKEPENVSIPLVITKEANGFHGFVPGFVMQDIVDTSQQECMQKLVEFVKIQVKYFIKNNLQFPQFFENDLITKDFKNVVQIKRITIKK